MTFSHGAQPKLIETVYVTGKRTTSRRSMGGCQIIRTGLFPHSSDKAVTVSCGLGHTCRRISSRRSSSAAATLKRTSVIVGLTEMQGPRQGFVKASSRLVLGGEIRNLDWGGWAGWRGRGGHGICAPPELAIPIS